MDKGYIKLNLTSKAQILEKNQGGKRTWSNFYQMNMADLKIELNKLLKERDRRLEEAKEKVEKLTTNSEP